MYNGIARGLNTTIQTYRERCLFYLFTKTFPLINVQLFTLSPLAHINNAINIPFVSAVTKRGVTVPGGLF